MYTFIVVLFVASVLFGIYRMFVYDKHDGFFQFHSINVLRGAPILVVSAVLLLLMLSYVEVDAGTIGVVKRQGNPVRQLSPGAHLIRPIVDVVVPVTVQTKIVKPSEDASSHDLQVVHTEVTLAYHVDPDHAIDVLVSLNDDAENRVITPAILEAIKATTARYDAQELISERQLVRDAIEDFVKARLAPYHIIAETTSITDFRFSEDYEKAIEAKVTASQLAEKAQNDLARIKIEADQKVAAAEGEAKALEAQKSQITPELIQLRTIEMLRDKWDGHMPEVVSGSGSIPMLDLLKAAGK
jgi:prohibitin 2